MAAEKWQLRPAGPEHADALVDFIMMAGDGVPEYLWAGMAAPGEELRDVGRRRALRDAGGFSWQNAVIAEASGVGAIAGMIGYPLPDQPEPVKADELPPPLRPLVALEAQVPGSWYLNVLATRPDWRRQGLAQALMQVAEARARATDRHSISLVVSSERHAARALYEAQGFTMRAALPKAPEGPVQGGGEWVLYRKSL